MWIIGLGFMLFLIISYPMMTFWIGRIKGAGHGTTPGHAMTKILV